MEDIAAAKLDKLSAPIIRPVIITAVAANDPVAEPQESTTPVSATSEPDDPADGVGVSAEEANNAADLIPNDNYLTSPMFHEIANFFGIEPKFYETSKDQVSVITDWAITKGNSNKIEDIYTQIRSLEDKLMPPNWGETRYQNLYRYLRLASQRDSANKALKAFERGPMNG